MFLGNSLRGCHICTYLPSAPRVYMAVRVYMAIRVYGCQSVYGCESVSCVDLWALYCRVSFSFIFTYSLTRGGRWGTTDDFTTSFLHLSLFSTALRDVTNSRPVHSLMSPSHLFFCLLCLLPPFTVPCKIVLARPDEQETCPYHFSLHLFTMVRSSCCLIACWILAQASSLVT